MHSGGMSGRDETFAGTKSIVAVAGGMVGGKIKAFKHMKLIVELIRFHDIKTHARIDIGDAFKLSSKGMLGTLLDNWNGLVGSRRSGEVNRGDFGGLGSSFEFGDLF